MPVSRNALIRYKTIDNLRGLNHIRTLFEYITEKQVVKISYLPFTARQPRIWFVSPYILKEYRNRWFLLGKVKGKQDLRIMALDQIESIGMTYGETFEHLPDFHPDTFFDDVIGVTKSLRDKPSEILFKIIGEQAQYVLTKPLHSSQRIVERHKKDRSITFAMKVVINYELERLLLGYGENIQVLQPPTLAKRLRDIHQQAADLYGETL